MTATLDDIRQDQLALAVAQALAVANGAAAAQGKDVSQLLVTVTEESPPPDRVWRVHYGPREYRNRRGGDLIVLVNERLGTVERVIRGQ
jgi:hypothetical protein